MVLPRRRHHSNNRLRCLAPIIVVVCGGILLFLALLSFLVPPPLDTDHLRSRHNYFVPFGSRGEGSNGAVKFSVPVRSGGGRSDHDLWSSRFSKFYYGCSNASHKFGKAVAITVPNRFLMIATSGGLNQQRTGITDAVVAARILNATLVVPKLDQKSFWRDASNFSEIFDVDWFIKYLSKDVKIIKQLPEKKGKTGTPYTMRVPRKCSERCYQSRVLPVILKRHIVRLTKFDYRLANKLDTDLQKLRCRVNYHALRFTVPILDMGRELVHRMRIRSKHYIALHLRFEPDMLAFSGCYYGGGEKERKELGAIRKRWKTLHVCLDVHIYVASGEVYGGEETLAPLKALFPNFYSKDTIGRKEELQPFAAFSARMAALDFIVCDESDVFVTNNNGNMAKILAGRRRYFGHKPTIRPNAKKLSRLFLNKEASFHENPSSCICEESGANAKRDSGSQKSGKESNATRKDFDEDDQNMDDELEWMDPDDEEDQTGPQETGLANGTGLDYGVLASEEPELEEMLSD
ncbi:O-fucosyltransferase 16 [Vitis vinifera]|uniref:O-fucosyltransferase family protein n=1 Tax=Vitis vinifera TaxID=29760 RepID=A0A438ESZ2_VITVI|nr:O-fucosyltransferase 16 [Vitis vinifera]